MQKNSTKKLTRINRLAPTSEHSPECVGASPIAPVSSPATWGDTPPLRFILYKNEKTIKLIIKEGQKNLVNFDVDNNAPNLSKIWRKINRITKDRQLQFRNKYQQDLFVDCVRRSFDYRKRLEFKDVLANKVRFA